MAIRWPAFKSLCKCCSREWYGNPASGIVEAAPLDLLVKVILNISDANIISAAMWHSTGKASMTSLEQILFIAELWA